ncbi:MAG TPA: hypothetical protein V6C72_06990 [Chroococcales cyanobacterium]
MAAKSKHRSQSDFQKISLSELRCVARPRDLSWMHRFDVALKDKIELFKETFAPRQPKEPVVWIFSESGEA